ncbi:hypothetical protein J5N97_013070 [Dioscorea zingiberensis]|uniref:Leucine-rich repeat-containing N-terminal plant-type domain-containing protein n=1 Tax=Dioscorea zingiberensis TaxID=325984 RepID=A0A9D5HIB0_9LILI|nr:hypothetical protein J5N97_013070 [Dioscorea zingiberensis]
MQMQTPAAARRKMKAATTTTTTFVSIMTLMISILLTSGICSMLDPKDFLALQSIHSSLEDMPGSTFLHDWDFSSDPCSFPGVLCNPAGRVVSLSLGDPRAGAPGLTGKLHPFIGRLSELTELSLVPGRVYGPIPPTISLCQRLRFLALSENFLSGTIPPSLSSLHSLQTLDLSFNLLSGQIPQSLPRLSELSTLILSHNRLSGNIPATFDSSSRLLRLDLKHNNLYGEIPPLPPSLRYLSLSSNNLSGYVAGVLPRL